MKAIFDSQSDACSSAGQGLLSSRSLTKQRLVNALATSKSGRIALHAACLFRHPSHAPWHWRGMLREFAG